jgi:hypothetical protein
MPDAPHDKDFPPLGVGGAAGRPPDEESLDRELQRVGEGSGVAFSCLLVDAVVTLELELAMSCGNELAIAIFGVLGPYIASIEARRSRRKGDLCLCCDGAPFFRRHKPTIIALLLPLDVENPGTAVIMGICKDCALSAGWPRPGWRGALLARMMPELRKVWPGCGSITVAPGLAGTA